MPRAQRVRYIGWVALALTLALSSGCGGRSLFRRTVVPPKPAPVATPAVPAAVTPADSTISAPSPQPAPPPQAPVPVAEVPPAASPPPARAAPVCPPDDPVEGRAHYMAGLDALQVGDAGRAREALFLSLCKTPDNDVARRLLRQVESPPETFFQEQYTAYEVRAGDTLSKIAQQAYGDPFLFYALARYNGIDNPSQLRRGQELQVPPLRGQAPVTLPAPKPSSAPAVAAPSVPRDEIPPEVAFEPPAGRYPGPVQVSLRATDAGDPAPALYYFLGDKAPRPEDLMSYTAPLALGGSTTVWCTAEDHSGNRSAVRAARYQLAAPEKLRAVKELRDRGELGAALAALEPVLAADASDAAARRLYREVAVAQADALVSRPDLLAAREVLQRAETLAAGSPEVARRLADLDRRIGIEQLLTNATHAMETQEYEVAYTALNQVLELDPAHAVARGKLVVVRTALIDQYTKAALVAYRHQELKESIRLWDRVLELDPTDETAQLRRAEAVHLQQQFKEKFQ